MLIIGITGGIGSGKGLATEFFRSRGALILDADEIARELSVPGSPLLSQIAEAFGASFLREDGSLDRRKLADWAFSDPQRVARLNALTHPPILAEVQRRLERLRAGEGEGGPPTVVCLVAPLLLEAGWRGLVDRVLVITAAAEERIRRVMERDGVTEESVRRRMAAQMPPEQQTAQADWVVDTTEGKEAALRQLEEVWEEIVAVARGKTG